MQVATVILAAGRGTRMKSALAKPLHRLLGRPLTDYAVELASQLGDAQPVFVVGYDAEQLRAVLPAQVRTVDQAEQLGTGHAVQQASTLLAGQSTAVLVWAVDMPLLTAPTLQQLVDIQRDSGCAVAMLTVLADDPRGFGRVVRGAAGQVLAIVEEADATPEQRLIRELNAGVYCFDAAWLWATLPQIPLSAKGEYYLTDLVGLAVQHGRVVLAQPIAEASEAIGINTRVHLAEAGAALQRRINTAWMLAGVTLIDPATAYIEPGVQLAADTVIWPNTHLQGSTTVGPACEIGPNCIIRNTQIGAHCKIEASVLEDASVADEVHIGPFGHLRKGARLDVGVHMGNFGEVKNSYLGPGVKMGHFSYVGDAEIGARTNIGAGTITCNFGVDGKKHKTVIGEDAYIGSDTMLVAPVQVGVRGRTGAGTVVTSDIPADSLAVGVPSRVIKTFPPPEETAQTE